MLKRDFAALLKVSRMYHRTKPPCFFRPDEIRQHLPVTMPIPQKTLKAIAAYLVGGRPKNDCRELFLQCCRPYNPVSSPTVCYVIKSCMQKADLPEEATTYWLRHYGERYKMVSD